MLLVWAPVCGVRYSLCSTSCVHSRAKPTGRREVLCSALSRRTLCPQPQLCVISMTWYAVHVAEPDLYGSACRSPARRRDSFCRKPPGQSPDCSRAGIPESGAVRRSIPSSASYREPPGQSPDCSRAGIPKPTAANVVPVKPRRTAFLPCIRKQLGAILGPLWDQIWTDSGQL